MTTAGTSFTIPNNLSRRQATILSKRKAQEAAEALQQASAKELEESQNQGRKCKKDAPPAWSEAEKDIFFQGVLAHGRDFDSLHKFCIARRKQGHNDAHSRNKDQIRHYYYRTVKNLQAKLSGVSTLSSNKEANELFLIVNWAELRRRFGPKFSQRFLGKHRDRLCQMINEGEIRIKHNGSMRRIRTPTCPPLKNLFDKLKAQADSRDKLAKKEEKRKVSQPAVPDIITVELQPRTSTAWQRVSDIQHNPHLRLKVKSEQSLNGIIDTLEKKWIPATSRFRRELGLDANCDKIPHIKLYPERAAKFRPFQLSLFNPKEVNYKLSLEEYLKLNGEEIQEISNKDEKAEQSTEPPDPARFLREKLEGITSQILSNTATEASSKPACSTIEEQTHEDSSLLSTDLIAQAGQGWSVVNSKELLIGYIHLMHGCPEKLVLEYEFPDLEGSDHALHLFASVINRLVTVAEVQFSHHKTKKAKHSNTCSPPNSNSSPSTRVNKKSTSSPSARRVANSSSPSTGPTKRSSPSTRFSNIQAAPSNEMSSGNEFKRPASPLCSSLADAIAAKKQQVKPLKRRPIAVHKTILPNPVPLRLTNPLANPSILPKLCTTTTHMNLGDIGVICTKSLTTGSVAAVTTQSSHHRNPDVSLQTEVSGVTFHLPETSNHSQDSTHDLLAQAMSSLKTPVKSSEPQSRTISESSLVTSTPASTGNSQKRRRIIPIKLSTEESSTRICGFATTDTSQTDSLGPTQITSGLNPSDSMSELSTHSLSSLLNGLTQQSQDQDLVHQRTSPSNEVHQSFSFLQTRGASGDSNACHSDVKVNNKDTWLSPEITMNDFSLGSFLGQSSHPDEKSKLNSAPDPNVGETLAEPNDDTRMSFLNKLDVAELGIESNLDMNMMMTESMDYTSKFKFNSSSSLETPNKQC